MSESKSQPQQLKREVGIFGAMMLGMGSIVGTGVFISIAIGIETSGPAVILAIIVAAIVATCNGLSSAQLAASHPVAGGTYEYGYKYLNPWMGFSAGWLFLLAKSASAATAALGFAIYLYDLTELSFLQDKVVVALACVVILTIIVFTGLRRSSTINTIIVSITMLALFAFIIFGFSSATQNSGKNLTPFFQSSDEHPQWMSFLKTCALMFVAYTGYGRVATLGEEIHNPRKNIPIAIILTLIASSILYVLIAWVSVASTGASHFQSGLVDGHAPLISVAKSFNQPWLLTLLSIGAITAMLGVLLNLILGLSRIVLAMGRRKDMPPVTAKLDASGKTPTVATLIVMAIIIILVLTGDVKLTWSFSAFTVLFYYAITNLASIKLPRENRLYPAFVSWIGLFGCLALAFWVEPAVWLSGLGCLLAGWIWRKVMLVIYDPQKTMD